VEVERETEGETEEDVTALKRRLRWRNEGCCGCTPRETRGSFVKTAGADMTITKGFTPTVSVSVSVSLRVSVS